MDGKWEVLSTEQSTGILQNLREKGQNLTAEEVRLFNGITRLRALELSCYEGVYLVEGETRSSEGRDGVLAFLVHARGLTVLSGKSNQIHQLNEWNHPRFQSVEQARLYLMFFAGTITGEEGTFHIVHTPKELVWRSDADPALRSDYERRVQPLSLMENSGGWKAIGTLQYGNSLFYTNFLLHPDGRVDMTGDQNIGVKLPIQVTRYVGALRYDAF